MMTTADRRPAHAPRRSRVRFLSPATLRALTAAHDALVCISLADTAAGILSGVSNGAPLVQTVRALTTAEWHATSIAESAEPLDAHRASVAANACGHATRLLLADYEMAAERG